MRIRGVIFDLFHTLTGRESEWSDLPWTSDVLGIDRNQWNDLLVSRSRWRLAGEERDPYRILSALARGAVPELAEETIQSALQTRIQRFQDCFARVPAENVDTLMRIRSAGMRLGLLSNADAMERAAWDGSPLSGCFDAVIFSCDAGCVKPEREIYEACLTELGLTGEQCVFVGDGGSNELVGARAAGMVTVFMSGVMAELWPDRIPELVAASDHHITRIPDLLPILGIS
jgi:putative hydrolase of the HAD superfamily